MPTVSELTVVIDADVTGVEKGVKDVEKSVGGLGSSIKSGLGMGLAFGAAGAAIGVVGSALGALKSSVIDLNGSLEQSQIAFTTMLGSGEKAEGFLKELQTFAAQTPFEFPDLVSASKKMLAFGFESKQVVPLLTAVGDSVAAVGGGAEVIDGVTTAIGQMTAKGKVSAEEMGQLAERGIPAWDMLAKKLGVSTAEAMDMVSKGQVKAATFVEAFQEGSAQRFGGMMEKQSATWSGALSTISDALSMASAKAFKPFFDLISAGAIQMSKFVQSEQFNAWSASVSAAVKSVVDVLGSLIRYFAFVVEEGDTMNDFLSELPETWRSIIRPLGDMVNDAFTGNFTGAIDATIELLENFGSILSGLVEEWVPIIGAWVVDAGTGLIDNLGDMWVQMAEWLQETGITLVEKLATWAAAFLDWVVPMIPDLLRDLGELAVKIGTWIITDALPTMVTKLAEWGLAFVEWIAPRIPPMLAALADLLLELGAWVITTALPAIITKLGEWGSAFVDWVKPKIPPLLLELGALLLELGKWMAGTALPAIVLKLGEWATAFLDWVAKDVLPTLPQKLGAIMTAIGDWVGSNVNAVVTKLKEIGAGIVQGIQDGISGALSAFWAWLQRNFVEKIPETIRKILNLNADTGALARVGARMVEELKIGISNRWPSLEQLWERLGIGLVAGGGGPLLQQIGAIAARIGGPDFARAAMAISASETGGGRFLSEIGGTGAQGPFQFDPGGELRNFARFLGTTVDQAGMIARAQPMLAAQWALEGYLGNALRQGIHQGLSGAALAVYGSRIGQRPRAGLEVEAGNWYRRLFPGYAEGGIAWTPQLAMVGEREPEAIIPRSWFGQGQGGGRQDSMTINLAVGGKVARQIVVEGYDLAVRQGWTPGGLTG